MNYITYLLILVTLVVYSCDPSYDCSEVDTLPTFNDLQNVDGIEDMSSRINAPSEIFDTTYDEMVVFINTDAEYDDLKQLGFDASCSDCTFPNIDFTNQTLIGYFFNIGCDHIPDQRFTATSDSTYAFYAKFFNTKQCTFSVCPRETFNWLLVPKVEDVNDVEFYNGEFYYDCDC